MNEKFENSEKTGKQCRERWHNHLNPKLSKESFTLEDEIKVFQYQKQLGNRWSEIAQHFEGRNDNFIKNCFYSAIRRNLRKYNKKKLPSKQLKGTISSLLKNPQTKKILMKFPEHQNSGVKIEAAKEQKNTKTEKIKENSIKNSNITKPEIKTSQENMMKNTKKAEFRNNRNIYLDIHPFNYNVPKGIDDITPTLNNNIVFGPLPEESEYLPELLTLSSLDLSKVDSNKSEIPTQRHVFPEYTPMTNFQHYPTLRD